MGLVLLEHTTIFFCHVISIEIVSAAACCCDELQGQSKEALEKVHPH
jgi:hypothetical protein